MTAAGDLKLLSSQGLRAGRMGCRSSKAAVQDPGAKPQTGGAAAPHGQRPGQPLGEGDPAGALGMKHGYSAFAAVGAAEAAEAAGGDVDDSLAPIAHTVSHVLGRIVCSLRLDEHEGVEGPAPALTEA